MVYEELMCQLRACMDKNIPCEEANCGSFPKDDDCVDNLLHKAVNAIEELSRRLEQALYMPLPHWVPVTERLPRGGENVLAYYHNPYNQFIVCATWDSKRQEWIPDLESIDGYYITAWMPLPEPPKDEVSE